MPHPEVTILIPNYKTLMLTQICLRLLRQYTDPTRTHIIVIDNDSNDDSLAYLRTLKNIELIERKNIAHEGAALSHARALDAGLARVTTPYVLSIHTDTFVKHLGWLDYLLSAIQQDERIVGVGSWKLEHKNRLQQLGKKIEAYLQQLQAYFTHSCKHQAHKERYLRSHCALYRTDILKKEGIAFSDGGRVGLGMHKKLTDLGYEMVFLNEKELNQYLDHINNATLVMNPELGGRKRTHRRGLARIRQQLQAPHIQQVLADVSLDN